MSTIKVKSSHFWRLLTLALLASLSLSGCGGAGEEQSPILPGFSVTSPTAPVDTSPPTVSATSPSNAQTGVAMNSSVSATFSETMTRSTLNSASFTLRPTSGGAPLAGTVSAGSNTATIVPSVNLAASTQYTATITTAAKDATGNALAANFTWRFTTSAASDTTPPTVSSTS